MNLHILKSGEVLFRILDRRVGLLDGDDPGGVRSQQGGKGAHAGEGVHHHLLAGQVQRCAYQLHQTFRLRDVYLEEGGGSDAKGDAQQAITIVLLPVSSGMPKLFSVGCMSQLPVAGP